LGGGRSFFPADREPERFDEGEQGLGVLWREQAAEEHVGGTPGGDVQRHVHAEVAGPDADEVAGVGCSAACLLFWAASFCWEVGHATHPEASFGQRL
jgi:hypothetical protein